MKFRKIVSLTALLAFIALAFTGFILFICPHGRIAYWSDWRMFGVSKEMFGGIHTTLALLFLIVSLLHIYLNWSPIVRYMKNKAQKLVVLTAEFVAAAVITVLFLAGTYFDIFPFSRFLGFCETIKSGWEKTYGAPPYGHAEESSIQEISRRMRLDSGKARDLLREKGFNVPSEKASLLEIARANDTTPQGVYEIIKDAKESGPGEETESNSEGAGLGRKTLIELCEERNFDLDSVLLRLKRKNIPARPEMTIREIANKANSRPADILDIIRE